MCACFTPVSSKITGSCHRSLHGAGSRRGVVGRPGRYEDGQGKAGIERREQASLSSLTWETAVKGAMVEEEEVGRNEVTRKQLGTRLQVQL